MTNYNENRVLHQSNGSYFMSEELQRVLGVHPGKVQKDQHGGGGETEGGKFHGW